MHGGQHAADCWDLTVGEIRRQAPELTVLAVDLPGRRNKPGDLTTATLTEWANSVVADIEGDGLGEVVIVGHSMAGLTVPYVVAELGASRVREMVLAAAFIPPDGTAMLETFSGLFAFFARRNARKGAPKEAPTAVAVYGFCNGMTPAQRRFNIERFCPESTVIPIERVDRSAMPLDVPRTWILTGRDRAHPLKAQRASIDAIGGVQQVIPVDTCHNLMVSEPERLAEILVGRCRLYGSADAQTGPCS